MGAQKIGQLLTVAAGRCIDSANRRAAAKSEAATAICRRNLRFLGTDFIRERGVEGKTLLEVGGGIGATLSNSISMARAINVELTPT